MNETTRNDTRRWGRLAAVAAAATYALIVFGGIVRITGSGMGCGDDWPLCNGRLIPPMDLETMIEYGHRLAAAAVSVLVVLLAGLAWWPGRSPAWKPLRRIGALALVLLIVQVLLGAVTVWLELPPSSVVLHFGTGLALLVVLSVGGCVGLMGGSRGARRRDEATRWALALALSAFGVALLGALVANLDAGPACLGFPACNGSWLPPGGGLVQVHWMHRLAAYMLFALLVAFPFLVRRWRPAERAALVAAWLALLVGVAQIVVAAAMVLALFPGALRAAHLAAGAALVAVLVVAAWLVARPSDLATAAPAEQ
ncbi:MAG: COX15/CtaA family protein [Gemmatimonadetes bacterium]|nr:COX15/CtaA family protein [Gemmatimonadota bacterium]